MKIIIYLLGIDGSGKTTLVQRLTSHYRSEGIKATYFYARHFPLLLKPLKFLGRKTALKKTDEFKNYDEYKNRKNIFFTRHRIVGFVYGFIWAVDYLIVTWLRYFPKLVFSNMIIIDRFYLDTTINLSETLDLSSKRMVKLANIFGMFFPKTKLNIFIEVSPEIAFSRKTDIQSIRYLNERNERFKALSSSFNFAIINGEETPDDVFVNTKKLIDRIVY